MSILQRSYTLKSSDKKPPERAGAVYAVLLTLFVLSFLASLLFGSTGTSALDALKAALAGDTGSAAYRIVAHVRLPRTLAAVLAGSALAVSGVIIQAVLNNAMAAPNIIGVNSGAGLAATLLIALNPAALNALPFAAFFGAMAACLCIYLIAAKTGASRMTITLVGITVSSILTAGINTVKTIFPDSIYNTNTFLVGGISGLSLSRLTPACWMIVGGLICALLIVRDIDVLSLGEETAAGLGMNVRLTRFGLLMLASLLAGSAVSFAGLLGFVGLLVPHIARRFVGSGHRRLIPFSALGGAVLVLLCDLLGRVLFSPYELPVGIILSFVGGPFFLGLILVQRRTKIYD